MNEKCFHYRVAERELGRLTRDLLRETNPDQRATIRDLRIAQARVMDQHRCCKCEVAA